MIFFEYAALFLFIVLMRCWLKEAVWVIIAYFLLNMLVIGNGSRCNCGFEALLVMFLRLLPLK